MNDSRFKMKTFPIFLLFSCFLSIFCSAYPTKQIHDPEEAGMAEGDMILTDEQKNILSSPIKQRNGLKDTTRRWPDKTVVYKIIGNFDALHLAEIKRAINVLESKTCIRFREATDSDIYYVEISSRPGGCFTAVGYQRKQQEMNLEVYPIGEGCFRFGTILHEFMHALGFYHEQSSYVRDNYIRVMYENIIPGKEFNFDKKSNDLVTDFDIGYDYDSCLHYRPGAFSVNGEDTIVPLDPKAKIGQRTNISKKDIDKINVMYKCPIKL